MFNIFIKMFEIFTKIIKMLTNILNILNKLIEIWPNSLIFRLKYNFHQNIEILYQISRGFSSKSQYYGQILKVFAEQRFCSNFLMILDKFERVWSYFSNIFVIISKILIDILSNIWKGFGEPRRIQSKSIYQNLKDLG